MVRDVTSAVARRNSPYLFLFPVVLYLGIWIYYPIAKNLHLSLLSAATTRSTDYYFVGLSNYRQLIDDELFWRSLLHNLAWVGLSIAVPVAIGLVLAAILAKRRTRLLYAVVFFIPATVAPVMAAVVWGWIYNPTFGALNAVLKLIGLDFLQHEWLADEASALIAVNMIGSWGYFGFCTLIFLAGLQGIDPDIYDAAKIDGAGPVQTFFRITVPLLRGTLLFMLVYTVISSMKFFDHIYVATKGGPNFSTQIIAVYMFDLFIRQGEVNYASAMSVVLTAIILLLSIGVVRNLMRRP